MATVSATGPAACRYMATYSRAAWLLKIWVPLVVTLVVAGVLLAEFRVAYGFATGK